METAIDILGTTYSITYKDYKDDPNFEKDCVSGYINRFEKKIVICNMSTYPDWDKEKESQIAYEKETLRHEIVHGFLMESGLNESAMLSGGPWSKNEEMIDWFAFQGPKIFKAWEAAEAL